MSSVFVLCNLLQKWVCYACPKFWKFLPECTILPPGLCGFVHLYLGHCVVATVAVCGFGTWFRCFTAGCHVKSPLFPQSPLKQRWAPRWENAYACKTVVFSQSNALRDKHVVQVCRSSRQPIASSLSPAVQTVQVERRTSPFNGIERSLRHAVVIKTKSLPVSAATLSLYIAHDGRKHKHNPKLSANKHVAQICLSMIGCRRLPCRLFRWASNLAFQRRSTKRKRHWKIAQSCRSPTVSACLRASRSTTFPTALSLYIAQGRLRKDICYPSCSQRQNRCHSKRK